MHFSTNEERRRFALALNTIGTRMAGTYEASLLHQIASDAMSAGTSSVTIEDLLRASEDVALRYVYPALVALTRNQVAEWLQTDIVKGAIAEGEQRLREMVAATERKTGGIASPNNAQTQTGIPPQVQP